MLALFKEPLLAYIKNYNFLYFIIVKDPQNAG